MGFHYGGLGNANTTGTLGLQLHCCFALGDNLGRQSAIAFQSNQGIQTVLPTCSRIAFEEIKFHLGPEMRSEHHYQCTLAECLGSYFVIGFHVNHGFSNFTAAPFWERGWGARAWQALIQTMTLQNLRATHSASRTPMWFKRSQGIPNLTANLLLESAWGTEPPSGSRGNVGFQNFL